MFSRTEQFLTWIIGLSPLISVLPAKSVVSLMYLQILASRNAIHQSPCDRLGSRGAIWKSNSKTRVLRERAGEKMIFRTSSFRCCDMLWLIAQKPWICESVETTWHRANFTKGRVPCLTGFQPVQEQGSVRLWRWRFAAATEQHMASCPDRRCQKVSHHPIPGCHAKAGLKRCCFPYSNCFGRKTCSSV